MKLPNGFGLVVGRDGENIVATLTYNAKTIGTVTGSLSHVTMGGCEVEVFQTHSQLDATYHNRGF